MTKRSRKDLKADETNLSAAVDDMLQGIAEGVDEAAVTDDDESCLQGEEDEGVSMRERGRSGESANQRLRGRGVNLKLPLQRRRKKRRGT